MARALGEVGVKAIAILDMNKTNGDAAAAELHGNTGIPVSFYQVDIRNGSAIADVVSKIVETYGSIDIMINSAGIAE